MERFGSRDIRDSEPAHKRLVRRVKSSLLLLVLPVLMGTLAVLGMLPGSFLHPQTAEADGPGTLTIIVPTPSGGSSAQGPVGTNVTISGTGFNANDTYQIGYATEDIGCGSGFQPFANVSGVTTDGSGNLSTTLSWPTSLANVGTVYYICAQDASNSQVQSQTTFTVAGADSPAITVKPVAGPTPAAGTPTLPTSGYYPGSTVEIDGTNFYVSSGVQLLVYLTTTTITQASDLTTATQLQTVNGQPLTPGSNGQITATVQIPTSEQQGSYDVYLVTSDSQINALPSLMAEAGISITAAPTPTATIAPTAVPTSTPGVITAPPGSTGGPGVGKVIALFGLGGLSVVLLIVGVFLLASAASLPRQS